MNNGNGSYRNHKNEDQRVKTLWQDFSFRAVIITGTVISIGLTAWIIYQNFEFLIFPCASYECFSGILDVFKFPIAVATAFFALAGFVAVVFRSQQTAIQIQETINQNTFKNYIDHKKQFMEMLKGFCEQYKVKFSDQEVLYSKLFPLNSPVLVNFDSKEIGSDKSAIELWNMEFNKIMDELYSIFEASLLNRSREVCPDIFAKWLSSYTNFLAQIHVSFDKSKQVSDFWGEHYFGSHDFLMRFPENLNASFPIVVNVLTSLRGFCVLPNSRFYELKGLQSVREAELSRLISEMSINV